MPAKPDPQTVATAQKRLAAAKTKRDNTKADADREFWADVAAAIDNGELLQTEACEAIGYKREYVRRQLLEFRSAAPTTD
ncbi:hypothetical protein OG756_42175 (plasmid) [Streptomyces sp. NBC_01310]|uniref:hypothetical protein n=1 Tax=Streptomyces sp. NBC_01310 TaxID=2903820 RepID=UPI0035B612C4|nr:hypothetical protein OG756_42175 [Streptomyces sp. NBC_01310]